MNTETLSERKMNLIVRITKLDKEDAVRKIEETVELVEPRLTEKQLEMLKKLAKPMRKKLDIEELKREQNWKPSTQEEIDEIVKNFDWQISLEELKKEIADI